MTNEEYIQMYPHRFKDELDRWLFRELSISGGSCSSIKILEYDIAREVGEKLSKTLIDKACKWIENRLLTAGQGDYIEEFRKEMEESYG